MNPSISMTCDAVFGAGSENFGTVTGNVTFQDGSANSGTVNGNATFEGNAENRTGATVSGNATFGVLSVNNGTVTGTVVEPSIDDNPPGQISFYQFLMINGALIQQYSVPGFYNGRYAFGGQPYLTLAEAETAAYNYWLANNTGVSQYTGAYNNGTWAYNQTVYGSQAEAQAAQENAEHAAWLAANTGINQYLGAGSNHGQWFINGLSTSYSSQADALEVYYPIWLAANVGVNQYSETGPKNGQWAFNSTEYASQAEALDAAALIAGLNGIGNGLVGQSDLLYISGTLFSGNIYGAGYGIGMYFANGNQITATNVNVAIVQGNYSNGQFIPE